MKTLLVALCFAGGVLAHRDHDISKIPGCEKAESFKDIKVDTCCAVLPKYDDKGASKECSKACEKHDFCCKTDCYMKPFLDNNGKFEPTTSKAILKKAVNNDAAWPIDAIVDNCVASAPAKLKEWEEKMASKTDKKDDKKDKKEHKKCANPENFVIGQCIRREAIIQCPSWTKSDSCNNLMSFAKSCSAFPFMDKGDKDVEKKSENGNKKSPAKKSKREAAADDEASTKKGKKHRKGTKKAGENAE